MAKFLIEAHGQKFEVEAPDEQTALDAFASEVGLDDAPADQPPAQEWERAALLPMETNKATGERRWAVPGLLEPLGLIGDVITGKETGFNPGLSYGDMDPALLDRAAGTAGFMTGGGSLAVRGMVGATARNLVDTNGAAMPRIVADALENANIGPAQIQQRLDALGPAGVIGDLSPRLQARVGAVATTPGPAQDELVLAMRARQAAANARIKDAVGDTFGPEPIPSRVAGELDAARIEANKAYPPVFAEKAMSGATPYDAMYDAKPIYDALDQQVPNFLGETRSKIQAVRDLLINPQTGELTTDPQMILAARQEIDGMVGALKDQGGNRTTIKALGDMRRMIDDDLARQVPGIKTADAGFAQVAEQGEAFDIGREVLRGGENPMHPVDLQDTISALKGPDAALRLSQGTLSKIYETIGTTANDRVALKKILSGEGSWNREKLATVFGEAKAKKLIELLDAEATMARTENLALEGSKTEVLRSGKDGIEPKPGSAGMLENAGNFQIGTATRKVADALLGGVFQEAQMRNNSKVAAALLSRDGWHLGSSIGAGTGLSSIANPALLEAAIERSKSR